MRTRLLYSFGLLLAALFAGMLVAYPVIPAAAKPRILLATPTPLPGVPPPGSSSPGVQIIGGQPLDDNPYPWLVALFRVRESNLSHFCGGALIAPQWVLTAAHCFVDVGVSAEDTRVVIGQANLGASDLEIRSVSEIRLYPAFRALFPENGDLALVRLASPSAQAPLPLAAASDAALLTPGTEARVMGWGNRENTGQGEASDFPIVAHEVTVPLVSNATCQVPFDSYEGRITPAMICAGLPAGGRDACQGDSGGPLIVSDGAAGWLHAGIVSFGNGCGLPGFYGVYARTTAFTAWIDAQINGGSALELLKSGPETAAPGAPLTYTLRLENTGTLPLSGLVLTDTLPTGASYLGSSDGGVLTDTLVTWTLDSLPAGTGITRTLSVSATGTITNSTYGLTATAGLTDTAAISATGRYISTTLIDAPRLRLSLTGPLTGTTAAPVTYTLTLANEGLGAAAGVGSLVLSNTLPVEAGYVGSSDGGTRQDGVVRWQIGGLGPGELLTRTVTLSRTTAGRIHNITYQVLQEDTDEVSIGYPAVLTVISPSASEAIYLPIIRRPGL